MRKVIPTAAIVATTVGAAAADGYPDLRGTWQGEVESVVVDLDRYQIVREKAAIFGAYPITLTIVRQDGRRFAGKVAVDGDVKPTVGVLTTQDTMLWTLQGQRVEARLLDSETIDYCYVRPDPATQQAACGLLKRGSPASQ